MTTIPVLTTERLSLRAHEPGDLDAVFAMWSDRAAVRYIGGMPSTRAQCWSRLLAYQGLWQFLGFGYWAVTERETGAFLGDMGFADFKRAITPSIEGMPEAGWVFALQAAGRGYATEAARAALAWLDGALPGGESVCFIDPGNAASLRVAEKCGFARWTETTYMDDPVILFRRPQS